MSERRVLWPAVQIVVGGIWLTGHYGKFGDLLAEVAAITGGSDD